MSSSTCSKSVRKLNHPRIRLLERPPAEHPYAPARFRHAPPRSYPRLTRICQSMLAIRSFTRLMARRATGISANFRRFIAARLRFRKPLRPLPCIRGTASRIEGNGRCLSILRLATLVNRPRSSRACASTRPLVTPRHPSNSFSLKSNKHLRAEILPRKSKGRGRHSATPRTLFGT